MASTTDSLNLLLGRLKGDVLAALCDAADLPRGRTVDDRRRRLAAAYEHDVPRLVDALRRDDLIELMRDFTFEVASGTFVFGGLHKATVPELRKVAVVVFVEGWRPTGAGDAPVRGVAVKVYENDAGPRPASPRRVEGGLDGKNKTVRDEKERDLLPTVGASSSRTTPIALEDFQRRAVHALDRRFERRGARGMLCLPTGGGKTLTTMTWLLRTFTAKRLRVLWITHRVELLGQAIEELRGLGYLLARERPEGIVASRAHGWFNDLSGDFVFASAQSIASRGYRAEEFFSGIPLGIIVYDEAHRAIAEGTWAAIDRIRRRDDTRILGLTATPFRLDGEETRDLLENFGGEPMYGPHFTDLVRAGFLARPIFETQRMNSTYASKLEPGEVRSARLSGELPSSVLRKAARDHDRNEQIVELWTRGRARYGRTLVFACDVAHAEMLAEKFESADVSAGLIHSSGMSGKERQRRISEFEKGETSVLVNVGIMTEGTDIPEIRTVLMARPTLSRSLYVQMIGRGARGPKKVRGKTTFHVIDCVDNFGAHGIELAGPRVAADFAALESASPVSNLGGSSKRLGGTEVPSPIGSVTTETWSLSSELAWIGPSGYCAVATFRETWAVLAAAMNEARKAMDDERWNYAVSFGRDLERAGAIRIQDWERMVRDCRATRNRPSLVEVAGEPDHEQPG